jgi:hypothetical protein
MFALCVVVPIRRQITVSEFRDALGGLVSGLTHEELKLLAAHFDMDGERRSALFSETCPALVLWCCLQRMERSVTPSL